MSASRKKRCVNGVAYSKAKANRLRARSMCDSLSVMEI